MSAVTPDPQQTNGFHSLSRLKRTLSLPLSKIKTRTQNHRETNKAAVSENHENPSVIVRAEENGNSHIGRGIIRNQSIFRSMRGPIGRKVRTFSFISLLLLYTVVSPWKLLRV